MSFVVLFRNQSENTRAKVLCATEHEFMATDAVYEYAVNYFQSQNPDWQGGEDPMAMDEEDWVEGGPRVEHEDLDEVSGNMGALVRVISPDKNDVAEFYYTRTTPYVKEEMLRPSALTQQFETLVPADKRKGDVIHGALEEHCKDVGMIKGRCRQTLDDFV